MKKINVLQFICSSGFYGAERWILALSKHFDDKRIRSDLAITLEGEQEVPEIEAYFKKQCGETFNLPMKNKFDYSVVEKLAELIKSRDIDIIHTHGYKSDIIGTLAARKAGIKIVITPHGFSTNIDFKLKMFIWLGCQFFRFADRVVPLSPQLMDDMKGFGVKENKLSYVQNGVDLSEVELQRAHDDKLQVFDKEEKRIGFIGQMIGRKNIKHILDIFDQLQEKHGNLRLFFLGDGDSRNELEEYAKSLSSYSHIEFLGFRNDRMVWLESFDLFVMTSVLEGIPRCLMETLAMGVPVAAYDISGVDQLIKHEKTGLLAPLNDKETLSTYWEKILFDDQLAKTLSKNGRDYVNEYYSAQRMATEYAEIFDQLVEN